MPVRAMLRSKSIVNQKLTKQKQTPAIYTHVVSYFVINHVINLCQHAVALQTLPSTPTAGDAALATVTPLHRAYGRFISAISRVMSVHSSSRLVKLSSSSCCLRSSSHRSSSYANSRCGWIITFSRRARTKQYARGKDMPNARITSAMQMVALRETPTRQCTKVAMPFCRPRSVR